MNTQQNEIRLNARDKAIAYGFTDETPSDGLHAPLGKFESEPYYILYFYDAMMNGDGEPLYTTPDNPDCTCDGTLLDVSADERAAFELDADTVAVVIWHSDHGFETLQELDERSLARITRDYSL